ncbi:MAG TPA: GIY-YIG nuclease family protein [Candidatus Binatia bacterium]|jgi:predicted GIY-YIG superfamily endonuclease
MLRCSDGSYYTGHTDNLEERLAQHHSGEVQGYTSTRLPVRLIFSQEFPAREEDLACERQIKGWSRKKKEALARREWAEISRLAKGKEQSKSPSTGSGRTD